MKLIDVLHWLEGLTHSFRFAEGLDRRLERIESIMATVPTRDDFSKQEASTLDLVKQLGDDVKAAIADLMAKVQAGQDFSEPASKLQEIGDALATIDKGVLDSGGVTPTPTPTPGPDPGPGPEPVPIPPPPDPNPNPGPV